MPVTATFANTTIVKHASALVSGKACRNEEAVLNLLDSIQLWRSVGKKSYSGAKSDTAAILHKMISRKLKGALNSLLRLKAFHYCFSRFREPVYSALNK